MDTQEKDKDFSKIPHAIIDSGLLDRTPNELKVYLVINRFANYTTGLSYPTVETIIKLSGVNKDYIASITGRLALLGLIEKKRTGKRFGFRNCYRVIRNPKIDISIIPKKTDKCRKYFKGKDGKFKPIPKSTDNNIPNNTDLDAIPINTDKKENYRDINNRDNVIEEEKGKESDGSASACLESQASPASDKKHKSLSEISNKTLLEFKNLWGSEKLKQYLIKSGYPKEEVEMM